MPRFSILVFALMVAALGHASVFAADEPPKPPEFECRFAAGRIEIDGKADEEAWEAAEEIGRAHV